MAQYAIRVKSKSGQQVIQGLNNQSTILDLKNQLSSVTKIPVGHLHVLSGFPPKAFDLTNNNQTLNESGLTSGCTLIVEEKICDSPPSTTTTTTTTPAATTVPQTSGPPPQQQQKQQSQNSKHHIMDNVNMDCPGILMKQVVPADNSCLFTSIGFVLSGKIDTTLAPSMRQIIAETVAKDTENYCEAILGKPNKEYCKWILKSDSWGGAIELAVLSNYYGIEMAVVDTLNAIINRFGEDQKYAQRVFLLFDGIHYDPLFLEPLQGGDIQTIFPVDDERILREAEQLAQEAKSSRQFTDVNKFTLKCLVCSTYMTGQVEAQQHAKTTGHMNFGEV